MKFKICYNNIVMMRNILLVMFLVFLSLASFAAVNFPAPSGFVNDYAGILSSAQKQELESISQDLKQATGAELAVAIVKTVEPLDSKLYAVKLFEKWGVGEKGKDNGVLLLLTLEERRIEIEVGYGLEGVINDALAGQILDTYAVPNFKKGGLAVGVVETAMAISQIIAGKEVPLAQPATAVPKNPGNGASLLYVIIGIIVLGIIFRKGGSIIVGIFGALWGSEVAGVAGAIIGGLLGLFFGFYGLMFMGRGGGSGAGGGFGGFGGGRSSGGGSGRSW